jgi:hypothetical protein
MTPERAKERKIKIKATPLPERASVAKRMRRDENYVENMEDPNDRFETFFEFEQQIAEFAEMPPSRTFQMEDEESAVMEMERETGETFDDWEPDEDIIGSEEHNVDGIYTIMEEEDVDEEITEKRAYDDVVGFTFVQCSHVKEDGEQCRRQAPKGSNICSIHKRKLIKEG